MEIRHEVNLCPLSSLCPFVKGDTSRLTTWIKQFDWTTAFISLLPREPLYEFIVIPSSFRWCVEKDWRASVVWARGYATIHMRPAHLRGRLLRLNTSLRLNRVLSMCPSRL